MSIFFIVFLPLFGFIYTSFFGKIFGDKISQIITSTLLIISSILSWLLFFKYLGPQQTNKLILFNWITSGNFSVDWTLL